MFNDFWIQKTSDPSRVFPIHVTRPGRPEMDVPIYDSRAPEASSLDASKEKAARASSVSDSDVVVDRALEKRLILKIDLAVLPILFLLFLVSFVDRSNLANARIEGLEKSLHIPPKSNGYNVALFSFTIPYILFEVPANMMLKKVRPQWWLSGLMFAWGEHLRQALEYGRMKG